MLITFLYLSMMRQHIVSTNFPASDTTYKHTQYAAASPINITK